MAKILYIKANPKSTADSITFKMSEKFVEEYRKKNPSDEIVTLDLYKENIRFLTGQDLGDMFGGNDFDVKRYAQQFAAADKYIIAAPFWNLSIPAILKAYIDYVTYVGVTFKYTESGPVGLLSGQGKKAAYIVARGGFYSDDAHSPYECGEKYLRTIFGFMGISDISTIACEMTEVLKGEELSAAVSASVEKAVLAATAF